MEDVKMKKYIIAVLIGAAGTAAVAAPIAEQSDHMYVGGSIGRAKQQFNMNGASLHDKRNAFGLNAGYQFNKNYGVEGGVVRFGEANLAKDANNALTLKSTALYLAGTATMPMGENFAVFAKAGVAANRRTVAMKEFAVASDAPAADAAKDTSHVLWKDSGTRISPMVGLGASYMVAPSVALVAEYNHFAKASLRKAEGGKVKADMYAMGVRVSF